MTSPGESRRFSARSFAWICVILALSGCASRGGYYQDDGPPGRHSVDLAQVADAVPRHEPPSETGNRPYKALGKRYYPMADARGYRERGIASWYGKKFHGKRTSSGEPYDMYAMTAAHRTLPLPSYARVTNLRNGRSVVVKVNDRGPFLHNRLIDLSYAAAHRLGVADAGTGLVEVAAVFPDSPSRELLVPVRDRAVGEPEIFVQFGAFSSAENARSLRSRLLRDAFRNMNVVQGEDRLFRVRLGPVASVAEADAAAERAQQFGYEANIIVE